MSQRVRARTYWASLTSAFAVAFIARETPEVAHPKPGELGTYSVWWRWLLGLEPKHWRRFILAPIFVLFWEWFVCHIVLDWGPRIATIRRWFGHVERPQR